MRTCSGATPDAFRCERDATELRSLRPRARLHPHVQAYHRDAHKYHITPLGSVLTSDELCRWVLASRRHIVL
jgi:hypothetical protein